MAPLKPGGKCPPPLSGPTNRAPGRAAWLPPVLRSNGSGGASASCSAADLRLWHTTDMSNVRVCVSRFAAHGHRKGWWSSWLEVIGLRIVNPGFESHERDWGGIKGGARCGAVRSVGAGRARRGAGAGAVLLQTLDPTAFSSVVISRVIVVSAVLCLLQVVVERSVCSARSNSSCAARAGSRAWDSTPQTR